MVATSPLPLRTRRIGVPAGSISKIPPRTRISSSVFALSLSSLRKALGITTRPDASNGSFHGMNLTFERRADQRRSVGSLKGAPHPVRRRRKARAG